MPSLLLEMERLRNPNSGLGSFCQQLGTALTVYAAKNHYPQPTIYLPETSGGIFGDGPEYRFVKSRHRYLAPNWDFDLWHCTHQDSVYLPGNAKTKLILTIHDLNFLEKADAPYWKTRWKLRALQRKMARASALVFISNYTKKAVFEHLTVRNDQLTAVIYNGNSSALAVSEPLQDWPAMQAMRPFVFSIGLHPKKHYAPLLPILQKNRQLRWVIAGEAPKGNPYPSQLAAAAAKLGVGERLHFTGAVTESQKNWLYQHCEALFFPSLSEGFGLPVIEAMHYGKPVFSSDKTSLPEIGGDAAFYFTRFEADAVLDVFEKGMHQHRTDPAHQQHLIARAQLFSWERSAGEYWHIYNRLKD